MKNFVIGLGIGLFVMVFAFGMFYLGTMNSKKNQVKDVVIETSVTEDDVVLEVVETPVAVKKDSNSKVKTQTAILTSVSTKDYEGMSDYFADTVYISLHASECCGDIKKDSVVDNIAYLNNAQTPWLFDKSNDTLNSLSQNYPDIMGPEFITGISENKMVVSFGLDDNYQINEIHIIQNADLLLN